MDDQLCVDIQLRFMQKTITIDKNNNESVVASSIELKFHNHNDIKQDENIEEMRKRVKRLMELPHIIQRSDEWYKIRENMITASDWAAALGKNKYSSRNKLLRAKCGEKQDFFGGHMRHGVKYEPVANMIYARRNGVRIIDFGLIQHPEYSFLGASPDGITEDGIMVEIKCPPKREITGTPPEYYWIQVQGQLEICDLERCDFLECKIEECSKAEYFLGISINEPKESGIILIIMDRETREISYEYSTIGISLTEFELWHQQVKEKCETKNAVIIAIDYWKLVDVSCIPIYRDREWFKTNVKLLKKFWDDVLLYRVKGIDDLKRKTVKKTGGNGSMLKYITINGENRVEDSANVSVDDGGGDNYDEIYNMAQQATECLIR